MEVISREKLKKAMIRKCIGVSALAKAANVQNKIISHFLKDDSKIRLSTLGKICKALDVQPAEILKGDDFNEKVND